MAETVDRNPEGVEPSTAATEKYAPESNNSEGVEVQANGSGKEARNIDVTRQGQTAGEQDSVQGDFEMGNSDVNMEEDNLKKGESNQENGNPKNKLAPMLDDDDPFAGLDDVSSMDIFDLSNYTFGKKNEESKSRIMRQLSTSHMTDALRKNYNERGMRRSVGAVILVHSHNFPHVLLLQRSDGKGEYSLPGGRLRPGESDEEGLQRKLRSKLKPPVQGEAEDDQELDIGEKLCNWYTIDFNRRYYPYVPAHVTKPKEELHVYTVLLPNKFMFSVPKNLQLVAVPLFELFNNTNTYGDVISAVPALLSRWHINYC